MVRGIAHLLSEDVATKPRARTDGLRWGPSRLRNVRSFSMRACL